MNSDPIGVPLSLTYPVKGVSPKKLSPEEEERQLKVAAKGFEGYFIYTLLKEMQKTVPQETLFGSGTGGDIYQHLFHQALADSLSEQNSFGLSKMLVDHLHRQQERRGTAGEIKEIKQAPKQVEDAFVLTKPGGPLGYKPFYPIGR